MCTPSLHRIGSAVVVLLLTAAIAVSAQTVLDDTSQGLQEGSPDASAAVPTAGDSLKSQGLLARRDNQQRRRRTQQWIYAHAVLMSVAWVGLLPNPDASCLNPKHWVADPAILQPVWGHPWSPLLSEHCAMDKRKGAPLFLHYTTCAGVLVAQSRWSRPLRSPFAQKCAWFWCHLGLTLAAVVLVVVSFAIASSDSTGLGITRRDGTVPMAHRVIGTTTLPLLLLQAVAAFIRPQPQRHIRIVWNLVHHNLGRFTLLLAWATMWLGVATWRRKGHLPGRLIGWVTPISVAQGVIVMLYLMNQGIKKKAMKEEKVERLYQAKLSERSTIHRERVAIELPAGADSTIACVNLIAKGQEYSSNHVYGSSIRTSNPAFPKITVA